MNVSIVIATYGDPAVWSDMAWSVAYPSTIGQGAHEVVVEHDDESYLDEVRNGAAEKTTGDWLCFLDADDQLAPGYLDAMKMRLRQHSQAATTTPLLVPAVSYVHPSGSVERPRIPQKGLWPKLNECVIGTLVRRDMFFEVGGFRGLSSLEDFDFFLRCYDAGAPLVYVEEAVYRAHVRPNSRNSDQRPYNDIWSGHLARTGQM